MKICPACNQTYSDESLNFCLNDGGALSPVNDDNLSQQTVILGQAPNTNPKTVFTNQPISQQNWGTSPTVIPQPKKKSKAWLWILGIVGILAIFGVIGVVGLVGLVAFSSSDETTENNNSSNPPTKNFDSLKKDDLSKWGKFSNADGSGEFSNGEYTMQSKQTGFIYVLVAKDNDLKTSNATATITVRNVNGIETNLGYGLLVHGDGYSPLSKDYVFLIDSTKQSYRVAKHLNKTESSEVSWTRFPAIRSGTQTNEIQVKDTNGKMSFFINGQFATDVTDSIGYKDGSVGIYAGDGIPIAFSNLQLGK